MPRRRFFKLAEAMAMILEDDDVADGDVVVLPPSKVDEHSDCEYFDDNEMLTTDSLPGDVAGSVEVHYSTVTDKEPAPTATSPPKRGRCPRKKKPTAAVMEPSRRSSVFQSQTKGLLTTIINQLLLLMSVAKSRIMNVLLQMLLVLVVHRR